MIHPDFKQWVQDRFYPNGSHIYFKGKYFILTNNWWKEVWPKFKTPKGNKLLNDNL